MTSPNSFHPHTNPEDWQEFLHARETKDFSGLKAMLECTSREEKLGMLKRLLKPGTEITIELTEDWLNMLLIFRPGVLAEAERLKTRLPAIPWHAQRAKAEGDAYWMRLAQSYQGD